MTMPAKHWNDEYKKYEAIEGEKLLLLGKMDLQRVKLMRHFASHVGEILAHLTDILQPQDLDELELYVFGEDGARG